MTFGSEIESAHIKKGLSQKLLATSIGVSQQFLSDIENSHRFPSPEIVEKLASSLGLSADWLYYTPGQIPADLCDLNADIILQTFQWLRSLIAGELVLDISLTREKANQLISHLRD